MARLSENGAVRGRMYMDGIGADCYVNGYIDSKPETRRLYAEPGMLVITDTGGFTAGKGKVILRYIENNLPREAT